MSIIQTVNKSQFIDNLLADDYASWTYEDAEALFDYYEAYSEGTGEDVELDRVALRCEWTRADSIDEVIEDYDCIEDLEDLIQRAEVIEHEGGVLLFTAFQEGFMIFEIIILGGVVVVAIKSVINLIKYFRR